MKSAFEKIQGNDGIELLNSKVTKNYIKWLLPARGVELCKREV